MSNPFAGMEDEDLSNTGNKIFFVAGKYPLLKIVSCRHEPSSKFKRKEFFLALLEVVQSEVPLRPVGTIIEYMVMKTLKDGKPNSKYLANIKKLLMAAFDTTDPKDVDEALMALVIDSNKQAAAGKYVSVVATDVDLQNGGKFTVPEWKHATSPAGSAKGRPSQAQAEA